MDRAIEGLFSPSACQKKHDYKVQLWEIVYEMRLHDNKEDCVCLLNSDRDIFLHRRTCSNSGMESNVFFEEAIRSEYASLTKLSEPLNKDLTGSCRHESSFTTLS